MFRKLRKARMLQIIIILLLITFFIWQDNDIVVSNYEYVSSKVSKGLDNYVIVQISDLHNKSFGKNQKRLIQEVKKAVPDIIVITGDLIDANHTNIDVAIEFIKEAVSIAPVYFVSGNHEFSLAGIKYMELRQRMITYGVKILDKETVEISRGDSSRFYLIGLNVGSLNNFVLDRELLKLNQNELKILLTHKPLFSVFFQCKVDLALTGHAHGGQFRLPFIGGLYAPDQGLLPKYTSGKYVQGNTTMIVSRGLGNSIIPIRIFNRPEVVVIKLRHEMTEED